MRLSVIIPVYNERETVLTIIDRVDRIPVDKEIIVVDNCSTDGTREILQQTTRPSFQLILQAANMGKGNSVRKGIAAAEGDYVVAQDADLEYEPQDLIRILEQAIRPGVLAVFGSRLLGAKRLGAALPRTAFRLGGNAINALFRVLYRSSLTDVATCYKMMRTELARSLALTCDGFDLDFEIASKVSRLARREGLEIVEVPISYFPRTFAEGKKIRWQDGLQALRTIMRCRLGPVVGSA